MWYMWLQHHTKADSGVERAMHCFHKALLSPDWSNLNNKNCRSTSACSCSRRMKACWCCLKSALTLCTALRMLATASSSITEVGCRLALLPHSPACMCFSRSSNRARVVICATATCTAMDPICTMWLTEQVVDCTHSMLSLPTHNLKMFCCCPTFPAGYVLRLLLFLVIQRIWLPAASTGSFLPTFAGGTALG